MKWVCIVSAVIVTIAFLGGAGSNRAELNACVDRVVERNATEYGMATDYEAAYRACANQ